MPTEYHLVQFNIARAIDAMDSPVMAGFVDCLAEINALADHSPGFVWRLQTDEGDAAAIRVFDDPLVLANMSIWRDVESLRRFVHHPDHVQSLQQREKWFRKQPGPRQVLWWVPAGHRPDLVEARARLALLGERGSHCQAFDFTRVFPPPDFPAGFARVGCFATGRQYRQLDDALGEIILDGQVFRVPRDPFWPRFARGWEPESARVYESVVREGSQVLDIGAWIGPTVLFALARGAARVVAVEPNPASYAALEKLLSLNPGFASRVSLVNAALADVPGTLSMGMPVDDDDSSRFGLGGDDIEVRAITLDALMREQSLSAPDLVKIDIEGAETLLANDLERLSRSPGQVVHLSVHVPLFMSGADRERFASSLAGFSAWDDRGEKLSVQELHRRITSTETHPWWGTRHGNYFELILVAPTVAT
jgi:FkbM family methyltransferase